MKTTTTTTTTIYTVKSAKFTPNKLRGIITRILELRHQGYEYKQIDGLLLLPTMRDSASYLIMKSPIAKRMLSEMLMGR